jgi:predicted enzyme related to lactoylglutathione lyase
MSNFLDGRTAIDHCGADLLVDSALGRSMFSHLTQDLARAIAFYDAVLTPLGIERLPVAPAIMAASRGVKALGGVAFYKMPTHPGNGWMAALSASIRKAVDEAYAAAISAGAEDEGAPGLRPIFGSNYYCAYVRDLDGNKIHFVYRGEEATEELILPCAECWPTLDLGRIFWSAREHSGRW